MKYYYDPQNRRPYKERMRNRCIAAGVFIILCVFIASCIFGKDEQSATKAQEQAAIQTTPDTLVAEQPATETPSPAATDGNATGTPAEMQSDKAENLANAQASIVAAIAPENAPEPEIIDSVHIKNQKDVFLAEKIDQMLRRFKPMHSIVLVVEPKSNEIVAWGETKDYKVQNEPDYFTRNTFPAASLAKTITIAAAMESNRYSLNSPIPDRGAHHTLYKNQLRVPENYTGPTIELQDAYAKSANELHVEVQIERRRETMTETPVLVVGQHVGFEVDKTRNLEFRTLVFGSESRDGGSDRLGFGSRSCNGSSGISRRSSRIGLGFGNRSSSRGCGIGRCSGRLGSRGRSFGSRRFSGGSFGSSRLGGSRISGSSRGFGSLGKYAGDGEPEDNSR